MKFCSAELSRRIASSLESAMQQFRETADLESVQLGAVECHPCHGLFTFHLSNEGGAENVEIESFSYPNIGGFNIDEMTEEYSRNGVLFFDGVEAGGVEGDADVESKVFEGLRANLPRELASRQFPISVGQWLLIVGYSIDGLLEVSA